jgi:hypothetical protein
VALGFYASPAHRSIRYRQAAPNGGGQ